MTSKHYTPSHPSKIPVQFPVFVHSTSFSVLPSKKRVPKVHVYCTCVPTKFDLLTEVKAFAFATRGSGPHSESEIKVKKMFSKTF